MKVKIVDPKGRHYEVASLTKTGTKVVKARFQYESDAVACAEILDRERPGKRYVIVTRMGSIDHDQEPVLYENY